MLQATQNGYNEMKKGVDAIKDGVDRINAQFDGSAMKENLENEVEEANSKVKKAEEDYDRVSAMITELQEQTTFKGWLQTEETITRRSKLGLSNSAKVFVSMWVEMKEGRTIPPASYHDYPYFLVLPRF